MSWTPQRATFPSRTGPVATIIVGVLAMLLGPIIGFTVGALGLFQGVDFEDFANAQQITNGSSASLPADSEWMIIPQNISGSYSCDVSGPGGSVDVSSRQGIVFFTADAGGDYTITCDAGSGTLNVVPAANLDTIVDSAPGAATSIVVGLLVGFLGLVVTIIGIIWLVRVNRDRRAVQYGSGGYGGYGGPGGGYGAPGRGYGGYGGPSGGYGGYPQGGGYGQPGPTQTPPPATPQAPWGQPGEQPRYGQSPTEPPRYGERIDPQDPNRPAS